MDLAEDRLERFGEHLVIVGEDRLQVAKDRLRPRAHVPDRQSHLVDDVPEVAVELTAPLGG